MFTGIRSAANIRFVLLVLALFLPGIAISATWDGEAGDGNWSTPANWDGDVVPGADAEIVLTDASGVISITGAVTVNDSLEIGLGTTLVIDMSAVLTLDGLVFGSGDLTNDGIIQQGLNGTGRFGANTGIFRGYLLNNGTIDGVTLWSRSFDTVIDNYGTLQYLFIDLDASGAVLNNYGSITDADVEIGANLWSSSDTAPRLDNMPGGTISGGTIEAGFYVANSGIKRGALHNQGSILGTEITVNTEFINHSSGIIDLTTGYLRVYCIFSYPPLAKNFGSIVGGTVSNYCSGWLGEGDGTSWSDPLNWTMGIVPTGTPTVVIRMATGESAVIHLDTDLTQTRVIHLNGPNLTLVIDPGVTLNLDGAFSFEAELIDIRNGTIVNNGTLINNDRIESGASNFSSAASTFENNGLFDNRGTFNNFAGSLIYNTGTFDTTVGTTENRGTFDNECGGIILGAISNNPVNQASCDTTPPEITVPTPVTVEAASITGTIVVYTANSVDDIDGPIAPECAPPSGHSFALGTTVVTCSAADSTGNSATESFDVNVVDTTPPVLTVPADVNVEANAVLSTVTIGTATATDVFPVMITNDVPATFPLGTTVVTWVATDANGNQAQDTQEVTVVDTAPPELTVPADITVEANAILSTLAIGTATATDIFSVTIANDAPASFSLGTTVVTWTAMDANGNQAQDTQEVTVVDTAPPVLTVPADITVEANGARSTVAIGTAMATDVFPVMITNDAPATFPLGTTVVTWFAKDTSGNQSQGAQAVTVADTTPPTVIPPPDLPDEDATALLTIVDIGLATASDMVGIASLTNDAPMSGFPVGTTVVTWTAVDVSGNAGTATQNVTLTNEAPALTPVPDETIDEGDTLLTSVFFADSDSVSWTATVDYGDGGGPVGLAVNAMTMTMALNHVYPDNGAYPVTVSITDAEGAFATMSFVVTVNNVAPTLSNFLVAPALAELGAHTVSANVDFTDPGVFDTHTATIDWGDGVVEPAGVMETDGSGSASGAHQYLATGVYTVTISVTDKDGATSSSVFQFVVVYDSSGGFVTGGGWIDSPLGACQLSASCATLTGKANFGFVSKYKKGATTPTGNTEFQFKSGDLNFHSSSYDWLVIAGAQSKYKGTGTINGAGNYGFMLSAIDADLTPSTDVDLFRIKIWDKDNGDFVVYDNQMAAGEDADPTTAIGGGSIKIHKAKN